MIYSSAFPPELCRWYTICSLSWRIVLCILHIDLYFHIHMTWLIIITKLRGVPSFIIPISQVRKQTQRGRRHEPQSTQLNWELSQDLNLCLGVPSLDVFQVSHSPSSQGWASYSGIHSVTPQTWPLSSRCWGPKSSSASGPGSVPGLQPKCSRADTQ